MNKIPAPQPVLYKAIFYKAMILIAFLVAADQALKYLALGADVPVAVTGFFNLVLVWNKGVSFGLFQGMPPFVWVAFAAIICGGMLFWMWRAKERLVVWSLALVIGGAVGNVIDRLRFGAVVDFIDLHVAGYHWPAFNLADSAIVVGAGLLMWHSLLGQKMKEVDHETSEQKA